MKGKFLLVFLLFTGYTALALSGYDNTGFVNKDSIIITTSQIKKQFVVNCIPEININGYEKHERYTYRASVFIKAGDNYRIDSRKADIVMKAGKTIVLKPTVVIKKGSKYLARIEECAECISTYKYDKFFTPNNDGKHDYWNVENTQNMSDVKIYIYDRYGKLLYTSISGGPGWNGGNSFANDYWFVMTYKDCNGDYKEVKSHFSLIR